MQEQHRHPEPPIRPRALGIFDIRVAIHVPAVRAEEPVPLERGDVAAFVVLGQDGGVARHVWSGLPGAEKAAVGAGRSGAGGLASAGGIARSEQRFYCGADIALETSPRRGEILAIEELIVPLRGGTISSSIARISLLQI